MADGPPAAFVMHNARDAIAHGLLHIQEQVEGIEQAVDGKPSLAFDLAKTLVESVCRTVLSERSVATTPDDDLPSLFRLVTQNLPFLPPTASTETNVRKSLKQTINGLHTAVQGICELRNQCGFASHGSSSAQPAMEGIQARLAAEASDTIVGFLHRVHRQDRTPPPTPDLAFGDNPTFNAHLDGAFGSLQVGSAEFQASEVLFAMEPETYRIYLVDFEGDFDDESVSATANGI